MSVTEVTGSSLFITIMLLIHCCFADVGVILRDNADKNAKITVLVEDDKMLIKKDKLLFTALFTDIFNNNMIEHNFKDNDKIPHILKTQKKFKYYERGELLFIVYDLDFFDMIIKIRVPLNLFEINLDQCSEKEQLEYYRNKALKLEEIIKANDLILFQYEVNHFDNNSVFTVFTEKQLINNWEIVKRFYSDLYVSSSSEEYQLLNDFWVSNEWKKLESHTNDPIFYMSKDLMAQHMYFKLIMKQNSLLLVASFALNINVLNMIKSLQNPMDAQKILDTFSKDMVIANINKQDMRNTYYSEVFHIYFSFSDLYNPIKKKR
eukprot:445768_1